MHPGLHLQHHQQSTAQSAGMSDQFCGVQQLSVLVSYWVFIERTPSADGVETGRTRLIERARHVLSLCCVLADARSVGSQRGSACRAPFRQLRPLVRLGMSQ